LPNGDLNPQIGTYSDAEDGLREVCMGQEGWFIIIFIKKRDTIKASFGIIYTLDCISRKRDNTTER
jgi:hypothetical protein